MERNYRILVVAMDLKRALIHELANKVSALKSMAELKEDCLSRDFLFMVDNVDILVRYMLDIEMSKSYGEKKLQSIDIKRVLEDVISELNLFLKLKDINICVDICTPVNISTDEFLLKRILYNLLHNAVKFSPAGDEIHVRCELSEGMVVLSIQNKIDEVSKHKARGSGTGLNITKELANHINAEIDFQILNSKARVNILLPVN